MLSQVIAQILDRLDGRAPIDDLSFCIKTSVLESNVPCRQDRGIADCEMLLYVISIRKGIFSLGRLPTINPFMQAVTMETLPGVVVDQLAPLALEALLALFRHNTAGWKRS